MRRVLALAAALAAALAVFAAPAFAATICVGTTGPDCAAPVETDLQVALTRASTDPGPDEVRIGPGDFSTAAAGGFSTFGTDPVFVRGAGGGQTLVRSTNPTPDAVLRVNPFGTASAASGVVSDLSVSASGLANGGAALVAGTNVQDVQVTAVSVENAASYGIRMVAAGATARRVDVDASGPFAVGVGLSADGATLEDSLVRARSGVELIGATAPARIVRRSRIAASIQGIDVCNALGYAEDTSIEILGNGMGIDVSGSGRCGGTSSIFTGRQLTVFQRAGVASGTGMEASGNTTDPIATLTDSVFAGLATTIVARPLAGRTSTLTLARLAEPQGLRDIGGDGVTLLDDQGGHVFADPLLIDLAGGDVRLGPGSPAIDAGAPGGLDAGESPTDLAGGARILDGNGDGVARRDLGAFEAPTVFPPVAAPIASPLPDIAPKGDRERPKLKRVRLKRAKGRITLRASEAAKLRIQLRALPDGCRKPGKRCREKTVARQSKQLAKGANSIALKARILNRLDNSRRLVLRAVDPAGNVSVPKRISL